MKDLLVKCEIRGGRNAVCIQGRQRKYRRRAQYGCTQAVFRESARRQADSEIGAKVRNGNRTRAVKLDGSPRPMLCPEPNRRGHLIAAFIDAYRSSSEGWRFSGTQV